MEFVSGSGITRVEMGCMGSPVADKGQWLALYVTLWCDARRSTLRGGVM